MPRASISLVIINKDDPGIAATLGALERVRRGSSREVEIVVVDASAGRLDGVARRFPDVRWIRFAPAAPKPTIPEQRNLGVGSASGELLVFIDASCVPDPGWLERLVSPIERDGEMIVAGSYRSAANGGIRDEDSYFAGTGRYLEQAPTLNLAVHRSVFERVGGFDETFEYGSDLDFTWRAVDHGYRIRYVPEATVTHDWGSWRSDLQRSFRYGRASHRLYAKHPRRRRAAWREDLVSVAYPLLLLASPVIVLEPAIALLLVIPLLKNLRHRPVLTVVHHLARAAGILAAAGEARGRRARPRAR